MSLCPTTCKGCGFGYAIDLPEHLGLTSAPCPRCRSANYASRYERMDVALSEVCNLECLMCRRPQEKEFMSVDLICRILEEAGRIGLKVVSFSGGEPFVHPEIRRILAAALEVGIDVELVTNGTLVRQTDLPMLERLRCVTVSIDGPEKEHDYIRGAVGCWRKTMQTVEWLGQSRTTWGTNTVMQDANAHVLYDLWRHIRNRARPSYVTFTHVEVVPETAHLQIRPGRMEEAKHQIARVREECERDFIHWNDSAFTGKYFEVFADKTRRLRPAQGCPIPQTFLGVSNYGFFPCWHQGRSIVANGLIEALESPLCGEIIREGLERRCIGCNAANYSWSKGWIDGVLAAYDHGDFSTGIVHLTQREREEGGLRDGKRTIPMLERQRKELERT